MVKVSNVQKKKSLIKKSNKNDEKAKPSKTKKKNKELLKKQQTLELESDSEAEAFEFSDESEEDAELCMEVESFLKKLNFDKYKNFQESFDEEIEETGNIPKKRLKLEETSNGKETSKKLGNKKDIGNKSINIKKSKQNLNEENKILKPGTSETESVNFVLVKENSCKKIKDKKKKAKIDLSLSNIEIKKKLKCKKKNIKAKKLMLNNEEMPKTENRISKFEISELPKPLESDQNVDVLLTKNESLKLNKVSVQTKKVKNRKSLGKQEIIDKTKKNIEPPEILEKKELPVIEKSINSNNNFQSNIKGEISEKRELLKEKLKKRLQSASFRLYNENLYTSSSSDSYKLFKENPEAFKIYHEGFTTQVSQWPVNPLNLIISWLRIKPKTWIVADFGCGEATLAKSIKQKVYSLDLVANAPNVIECNMAHTPLEDKSMNVVVFCLSLMGTNLREFIVEANRVLVHRGVLKIAEVESRFGSVYKFTKTMLELGFECIYKNQKQNYFWIFDFLKVKDVKLNKKTPVLELKACIYKKR